MAKKEKKKKKDCENIKPPFTEKELLERLKKHFPEPQTELEHKDLFQLLTSVVLSAQTTDKKVNEVSPKLFEKYPDPKKMSEAPLEDLYQILKPINYYRTKAERLKKISKILLDKHDGKIPDTIEELTKFPGIGRKTASVILVNGFGKPAIVVDTHVKRVSKRLGLTCHDDPEKIEQDLARFFSKENWAYISNALVLFGRYICTAKNPKCKECYLADICPYDKKNL
ncbi:MAG: endonuclease III [Aquificae bacterium]|nr:endonuclease III [Aquificota bacterium]